MSWVELGWAVQQKTGSPTRKAVLLVLANHANGGTRRCDPHMQHIAEELELSVRTVERAISDLVEQGMLARSRQRRTDGQWSGYSYTFPAVSVSGSPPVTESAGPPVTESGQEPEVDLEPEEPVTANAVTARPISQALVATYIDEAREAGYDPPRRMVGHTARMVGELLAEGQDADTVMAALRLMTERRLHPSTLPSLIAEAALGPPRRRAAISDLDADYQRRRAL